MHRSRSREKYRRPSVPRPDPPSAGSALTEGSDHSMSRIKLMRTEHDSSCECGLVEETNSITLEFKRKCSKKASGMPIKALIDEEMSRKKHIRRSSPSLIARLMGLDALPSPGAVKPLKEVRSSSKKVLSNNFHEKITTHEDCSLRSGYDENLEFKDVFEVVQVPKAEKKKERIVKKGTDSTRQHEIDKAFIQQSFIDATSVSTSEMSLRYKELVDAEEDLDLNMDIFLPFLQEPLKHLHDLTRSPSIPPHAIYPSTLMASKDSPTASCQSSFGSDKHVDRCINIQRSDSQSFRKLAANRYGHPSREHLCSLLKKLSESTYAEKDEYCAQPTQIVILKPNLNKARKAERIIPIANPLNNFQYDLENNLKFPVREIMKLHIEEGARQKLHHTTENTGRKIKGSREVSKQMMSTSASERKKVSVANSNDYKKKESSCVRSRIMNGNNSQTSLLTSILYANNNNSNHSSSFLTESSVTKEARKRLSERWKLTNRFQEMGFSNRASSTLAEMLALSDNETPKMTLDTLAVKKATERKLVREDIIGPKNHPLGISSKDGWKDDISRSLPRSKSLPSSSLIHENSQWISRNRPDKHINRIMHKKLQDKNNWMSLDDDFVRQKNTSLRYLKYVSNKDQHHSDGEENTLIEREIHVSSEKLKINNDLRQLSEKQNTAFVHSDDSISERSDITHNLSVSQSNSDISSLTDRENGFEKLWNSTKSEKDVKLSECDKRELAPKETLINHDGVQLPAADCNTSGSVCPGSYKEADQPSPVSVLEAPFEDEEFSTDCFEKISADLQDLRMQLRLLKQESPNSYTEDMEAIISSDEDAAAEPFPEYIGIVKAFRDEEERDYSYVLDILIDGDILKAEQDGLFTAYHLTEHPVSPNLFDKLEKKYKSLESWSRSDRKLLFDLTDAILADIMKPKTLWQSKMVRDGLVEEVWQAVVKKLKNVDISFVEDVPGLCWLADLGDYKELLGRQLENILQEDLLNELLIELTTHIKDDINRALYQV